MSNLNRKEITRLEFLRLLGLSGASLFTSGILADRLFVGVLGDIIPVEVMIKPNAFKYGYNEKFACSVVFPEGYEASEVDISSVRCAGAGILENILYLNNKTIVFIYNSLKTNLPNGLLSPFNITGRLKNGTVFNGSDTVMIMGSNQPVIYHTSSRKRKSCNACKGHAVNRIYPSMSKANNNRAHIGCNCPIVSEHIDWQDYIKAFWHSSQGGEFFYDRRWGWSPPQPKGLNLEYPPFL